MDVIFIIAMTALGYSLGRINAYYEVERECNKLGKFFIGDVVYEVTKIERHRNE